MKNSDIKITKIIIKNIKNVEYGEIDFTNNNEILNMVGIYGQNGSGKTTVIDAINLCKNLILSNKVDNSFVDLLNGTKPSELAITFQFNQDRIITYSVELKKIKNKVDSIDNEYSLKILNESLETKELKKNSRSRNLIVFSRDINDPDKSEISPLMYFPNNQTNRTMLNIAVKQSDKEQQSIIFSDVIQSTLETSKNKKLDDVKECLKIIIDIAHNIFIFDNKLSGLIYAQFGIPFLFSISKKTNDSLTTAFGTIGLHEEKSSLLEEENYEIIKSIIQQINNVLPEIIPNLNIDLLNYGEQMTKQGKRGYRVELLSNRDGKKFPFRSESDGIKKIVSILSALITVYSTRDVIVAIDELDSGIYEFLLGDLLAVLSEGAKGQIIFTSHNLRPLETINERKIIFTTSNSNNRYIKAKNIKQSNNLRDVYLRDIQYKTGPDNLYDKTSKAKIQRSLRKSNIIQETGENYD